MSASASKKSALFICLGNICRSPIAEAVFNHVAKENGEADQWLVDSAAIGDWHVGKQPDKRARDCMASHEIQMNHRARQIAHDDFYKYQYIFGMDENNMDDLRRLAPKKHPATVQMFGEYHPQGTCIIRDPYYDNGAEGFEEVYQQCLECSKAFITAH